ncbi:DUF2339 domain-containing protein [Roseomonas fluvialis]|uniref:Membrane protein n=1 Tax=Roseomonas fluvialis TaxID=1750527 RepID=A0ABM7Y9Z7_9PROT|nr:DUF2339 domain-containing protein [Roseomonas fluvialis]BDG74895.1 membrane protein [Roseomonas fluvialis]
MEGLLLLLALLFFGGWIFGVAGFARAGAARREARALQAEIAALRGEVAGMAGALVAAGFRPPEAAPAPQPSAAPPWAGATPPAAEAQDPAPAQTAPGDETPPPWAGRAPAQATGLARDDDPSVGPAPAAPWGGAPTDRPRQSLEELITQRWGVWLGAGALMLAAVFLVRLAVEEGWLGPGLRSAAAGLLGVALVLAGEWLARRPAKGAGLPDLAPAALAAGGVAALFGAAYAATVLYGLLPPLVGFVLMAAAGVFGLLLSLRRGPLVAAVGLAGAFLTPALVASEDPSLVGLFAYLAVVTAAAMVVVRVTAWGWLGWCAAVAGALWVLVGTVVAEHGELWAPAAFVPVAAATFLLALPREALGTALGRALAHLPPVALGLALLPVTFGDTDIAPPLGVLMLSPVAILAARRKALLGRLPFIAAGLGLVALLVWVVPAWTPTGERVTIEGAVQAIIPGAWVPEALVRFLALSAGFALLHLLAGLALETRRRVAPQAGETLAWAGLAATVPVLTLLVAYARVRGLATDPTWALVACGLAAVHVGATARGLRAGDPGRAGAHAAGATAALALGVAMVLRDQWLTLAVAIFLPPLAMIALRFGLDPLRRVAAAVAAVVLVRLAANHFVLGYDWGGWPVLNGLLLAYGVPAACFWWAARIFLARSDGRVVRLLECGAALFATLLVLLEIRHALQDGVIGAQRWGFVEAAWQATALFACAWVALLLHRRGGRVALLWAARVAGAAGMVLGAVLLANNPWTTNQDIAGPLLLNALLPAYALPALLVALAVARAREVRVPQGLEKLLAVYALASGFAWVTLEVRRAFHPTDIGWARITEAEMYAYSGAWLVLGALLLAVGIRSGRKEIRLAALGVIALVTLKVFLVDMDALVGLWRVLSFLGLGLALIALGAIYRRFVVPAGTPGNNVPAGTPGNNVPAGTPGNSGPAGTPGNDGASVAPGQARAPTAPPAASEDGAPPPAPGDDAPRPGGGAAPPA